MNYFLQAIRHLKLNMKESPCESSPDYHFASCIEKRIYSQFGCQPFWSKRRIEPAIPSCQKATDFNEIMVKYDLVQELALEDLVADFECPMPCSYMKYEV